MQVSFLPSYRPTFKSNEGYYIADNGNPMGTYTSLFRADFNWESFTDFIVRHFKDKDNVQLVQFAASDGSEAYTQIISLLEHNAKADKFFPINAYDINENMYKCASSGLLNLNDTDLFKLNEKNIDINKYFRISNNNLKHKNLEFNNILDKPIKAETYEVLPVLTSKVKFHQADMKDILREHKDDSNTIILCRNVLDYLSDREVDHFTTLAACTLKKGSLFAIGEIDSPNIHGNFLRKGFIRIMPYVYMQT